jgi:hypothetical protein
MRKLFLIFMLLFCPGAAVAADAFYPAANTEYVIQSMARRRCLLSNNASAGAGANMTYLLKTIDICNGGTTSYGTGPQATLAWASTDAVEWCADNLLKHEPISSGLIVLLNWSDTAGASWPDMSGTGNNFTLYNSPTINSSGVFFNGTNQYARSANTLNLSALSAITIEVRFASNADAFGMVFEHSENWNNNSGGLGVSVNIDGANFEAGTFHTVQNKINAASGGNNYSTSLEQGQYHTITNTFSSVTNPTGRLFYFDGTVVGASGRHNTGTAINATFRNDYFYLASRALIGPFANISIKTVRIYNRQLTATEICANVWADYFKYGGTLPTC